MLCSKWGFVSVSDKWRNSLNTNCGWKKENGTGFWDSFHIRKCRSSFLDKLDWIDAIYIITCVHTSHSQKLWNWYPLASGALWNDRRVQGISVKHRASQHFNTSSNNGACLWAGLLAIWVSHTIKADFKRGNALSPAVLIQFLVEEGETWAGTKEYIQQYIKRNNCPGLNQVYKYSF